MEELRKQYKELLKLHHSDNGGNVSEMQEINAEYDRPFNILKDQHENNNADQASTRVCLKIAFCQLCVTVCGRFVPNEGGVVGYVDRMRDKSPAKWGVQMAGMNFKTHSNTDYNNMKYDFAEDEKLREMLSKVIYFTGIDIELVGAWIWVSGNTYVHKKELKEFGFTYAGQKKCDTGIPKKEP